jgi:hypothetical protein
MATKYPDGIDNTTSLPYITNGTSPMVAEDINRLRDAVVAVETELGVDPSGTFTSVGTRLQASEQAISGYAQSQFLVLSHDGYISQERVFAPSSNFSTLDGGAGSDYNIDLADTVGIGTLSPDSAYSLTLDGNGTTRVGGLALRQSGASTFFIGSPAPSNAFDIQLLNPNAGYVSFGTNNTERLRILSTGRVGIGTTTPESILHVVGDSGLKIQTTGSPWAVFGADAAASNYLKLERPGSTDALGYIGGGAGGSISGGSQYDLAIRSEGSLYFASNGNIPRMVVDATGNVGIGISSPAARIHVSSDTSAWATWEAATGGGSFMSFKRGGTGDNVGYLGTDGGGILGAGITPGGSNFGIRAENDLILMSGASEAARLTASGFLGIGTSSPSASLDVRGSLYLGSGSTDFEAYLRSKNNTLGKISSSAGVSGVYNGLRIDSNYNQVVAGLSNWFVDLGGYDNITRPGTSDTFNIGRRASGSSDTTLFIIKSNGNAGLGTTNPSAKLDVNNGIIAATGDSGLPTSHVGGGLALGNSSAGGYKWIQSFDTQPLRINPLGNLIELGGQADFLSDVNVAGDATISGAASINGLPHNESTGSDSFVYFSPQKYIEAGTSAIGTLFTSLAGDFTVVTAGGVGIPGSNSIPFSKVVQHDQYAEMRSDFIPVQAGETIYGEIWAARPSGAAGVDGQFFLGVCRFDKDKLPISSNTGIDYFPGISSVNIPADGVWRRYSGELTMPLSHSSFEGSDGGAVRYIQIVIIANYNTGTKRTLWGGALVRRRAISRDSGSISENGYKYYGEQIKTASLYVTGTGYNNNTVPAGVYLNGQQVASAISRGLHLVKMDLDLGVLSVNVYDTYASEDDAQDLDTAIQNMTTGQIGILFSYDAWEVYAGGVQDGARRVGLFRLAALDPASGSRRPYAAVFYGNSALAAGEEVAHNNSIEIMESNFNEFGADDARPASLFTYLASNGSTVSITGAQSVSALHSADSNDPVPSASADGAGIVIIPRGLKFATSPWDQSTITNNALGGGLISVTHKVSSLETPTEVINSSSLASLREQVHVYTESISFGGKTEAAHLHTAIGSTNLNGEWDFEETYGLPGPGRFASRVMQNDRQLSLQLHTEANGYPWTNSSWGITSFIADSSGISSIGYSYTTPRIATLYVTATEFARPDTLSSPSLISNTPPVSFAGDTQVWQGGTSGSIFAKISLPAGATITSFQVGLENSSGAPASFSAGMWKATGGVSANSMFSTKTPIVDFSTAFSVSTSANWQLISRTVITSGAANVINGPVFIGVTIPGSASCKFEGVLITYTYSSISPPL